jgi:hypothetical protein
MRLAFIGFLGLSACAVGLSRIARKPEGIRVPHAVDQVELRGVWFSKGKKESRWIDTSTGKLVSNRLPKGQRIDYASCSPWHDEDDRRQIVGRWSSDSESSVHPSQTGLARIASPSGDLLDFVETESLPISPPCWLPGTRARVVYAAADGQLYFHEFESKVRKGQRSSDLDNQPKRLRWSCDRPEDLKGMICDPYLAPYRTMDRFLFVSFREYDTEGRGIEHLNGRLWWLRLSSDGTAIEAAGTVFDKLNVQDEQRAPVIGKSPNGGFVMAFLRRIEAGNWELRSVPIGIDVTTNRPMVYPEYEERLLADCRPCPPIFSADGRSVFVVQHDLESIASLLRVPLESSLKRGILGSRTARLEQKSPRSAFE